MFKGNILNTEAVSAIQQFLIVDQALIRLASSRLAAGNSSGAAMTCIKAIGMHAENPELWIKLA